MGANARRCITKSHTFSPLLLILCPFRNKSYREPRTRLPSQMKVSCRTGTSNTISRPTIVFAASAPVNETLLDESDSEQNESAATSSKGGDSRSVHVKESRYKPSPHSRRCHNAKERDRRSRMKRSCQMMRSLVPGLEEKTDKATVLEHAVNYLIHLTQCPLNKCNDYQIQSTVSEVTRVQLLRACNQSAFQPSEDTEEDQSRVYLQVLPEEETSGLEAAEVLVQLQDHGVDATSSLSSVFPVKAEP